MVNKSSRALCFNKVNNSMKNKFKIVFCTKFKLEEKVKKFSKLSMLSDNFGYGVGGS